jgi:phosphoribosylamine--glycine ligase
MFDNSIRALSYIENHEYPLVIKADGLALGKGVIICEDKETAIKAIDDIMVKKVFGDAGNRVVIEEFLVGQEVTVLSFTDGNVICPMVSSQDHKRAYDGDKGLNTGGMGTFSPSRVYSEEIANECMEKIFIPTMKAMNKEGRKFKGVLYFGLILTKEGPKVIEYNSRFGDPETQVVLPRLETDLLKIFNATIDEKLDTLEIKWADNAAVCVVMASGGYPVKYKKGYPISGLQDALSDSDITVFHAGTKSEDGRILTNGGRVLGVTAVGENLDAAIEKSYAAVEKISFKDAHYRKDIGIK